MYRAAALCQCLLWRTHTLATWTTERNQEKKVKLENWGSTFVAATAAEVKREGEGTAGERAWPAEATEGLRCWQQPMWHCPTARLAPPQHWQTADVSLTNTWFFISAMYKELVTSRKYGSVPGMELLCGISEEMPHGGSWHNALAGTAWRHSKCFGISG